MNLNGQLVGWRHDHDLGRGLRGVNPRKQGQQISKCFTAARLSPQICVLSGAEGRNSGNLNWTGVENLLFRESGDESGRNQIGELHEIELATGRQRVLMARMAARLAVILTVLREAPAVLRLRQTGHGLSMNRDQLPAP